MDLLRPTLLALLLAISTSTARINAQPAPGRGISCLEDPACAQLLDQARESSKAGRLDEARTLYDEAYRRRPDPLLLFNLARVLHKAGRAAEAIPYYQRYIDAGAEGSEEQRRKAEQYLDLARHEQRQPAQSPPSDAPAASLTKTPTASLTPIYHKWWFWVAIGSATAAATAVGIGVGLAARPPDLTGAANVYPFTN